MTKGDVNVPKYKVGIWWYELHSASMTIKADSPEQAREQAKQFSYNPGSLPESDTFGDYGESGIDDPVLLNE